MEGEESFTVAILKVFFLIGLKGDFKTKMMCELEVDCMKYMVRGQLIVSKFEKKQELLFLPQSFVDSSRNTLQHRQGWIDGRKKWKKYEMIRDLGITFFGALKCICLKCCCFVNDVFTLALGQGTANVMG